MSSSSTNTGDTCNGTTGTPGLSTCLVTSLFTDGVCLPFILSDALWQKMNKKNDCQGHLNQFLLLLTVYLLDYIKPNWSGQNRWERERRGSLYNKILERPLLKICA